MPTAKKLPSGSYRVQVFSHKDGQGKRHYESFTAPTKKEAELKAAQWSNKKDRHKILDLTVKEAIEGYINAKEGVLSPSTIRGYRVQLRNNYKSIENFKIKKLNSEKLQLFISELSGTLTPKSVANIYGLLSSSLNFYEPDAHFHVTLPKRSKKRKSAPSDGDIRTLFEWAPMELKKCIAIGAFTGMRRGEICALTFGDIKGNVVHVTKDIVQASDKSWIVKGFPKTDDSIRDCFLPDKVLELIGQGRKSDPIIKYKNPTSITRVFTRVRDRLGLDICFHDLRHYYASIGAVLGIPDTYLSDFGGWRRGSSVMKEVYQNNITSMSDYYARKMAEHFDDVI
jgi:integrase